MYISKLIVITLIALISHCQHQNHTNKINYCLREIMRNFILAINNWVQVAAILVNEKN